MLFLALCGILVLAVAFYHYNQGFFSSAISAMLVVFAAVLAFSWHEVVVERYIKGSMGAYGSPVTLLVLFTALYVAFRMIFDRAVPGGIMLPAAVDKLGAAITGLVAAAFAVGLFAVAAQEMPFDTSVGGYARYGVGDRHTYVLRGMRVLDSTTYDELHSNEPGKFDESDRNSAYVDDLFMGTLKYLSEQGSLSGSQKLTAVHPDFLQEVFGQRLGIQPGATRVTANIGAEKPVRLDGIYHLNSVNLEDFFPGKLRDAAVHAKWTGTLTNNGIPSAPQGPQIDKNQMIVVVRLSFTRAASDKTDSLVRFSCGSVRIAATHNDTMTGSSVPINYFPWGTIEKGNTVYLNKLDDFLFVSLAAADSAGVDLMFVVDKDGFLSDPKSNVQKIADGVFLEFKRATHFDLGGQVIAAAPSAPPESVKIGVMQPPVPFDLPAPSTPSNPPPRPSSTTPARSNTTRPPAPNAARGSLTSPQQNVAAIGGRAFNYSGITKSNLLPTAVALPAADVAKPQMISIDASGVNAYLQNQKFSTLSVDPKVSVAALGTGDIKTRELAVPAGQVMYQISSNQPSETWLWAQKLGGFKLVCSDNSRVGPRGAWAIVHIGSDDRLLATYTMTEDVDSFPSIPGEGQPKQITLAFLLPENVKPKELVFDDQTVKNLTDEPIH